MVVWLIVLGLVAGMLAATLGIGGGIVYVTSLVALFSFAQHEAQGTSLAVIVPTMIVASYTHSRAGRVDWRTALMLGIGGVLGASIGARAALALDAPVLRKLFAGLLVVVSIRMLARTRRRATAQDA